MLKIVLTGGPCAGKTQILSRLTQVLEGRGYKVITVPEAATHLILNGICPSASISMDDFQNFVIDAQIANEQVFESAAQYYDESKLIFFYDRGIVDGCAYTDKDTVFAKLLANRNMTFADAYNRYDAVLHLVTAANGAEKFYQWNDPNSTDVGNNAARSESPEEARIKDEKTLNAWIGHPHLRVFDNSTDFDGKIQRVIREVFALLGEPSPSEIERKFLIRKPTAAQLAFHGCISKTNIIQTYLKSDGTSTERRVRQRGTKESGYTYFYTEKTDVADGIRIENERKITPEEYIQLLAEADTSLHQISKVRHCFVYRNQYFELDFYPFSDKYAILEIELNHIDEPIEFPIMDILKEVTNDKSFRNSELAKTLKFDYEEPGFFFGGCGRGKSPFVNVPPEEWTYETGRTTPEILGSGNKKQDVVRTKNEEEAFKLFKEDNRNYLTRERFFAGAIHTQWYDEENSRWF